MRFCDVIIPTFNNAAVISKTLQALYAQDIPAGWAIRAVVSDDGSQDSTVRVVERVVVAIGWKSPLIISNPHRGVAAARNAALKASNTDIVMFLGADIILCSGALSEHLSWHEHFPQPQYAALGMVKWDPAVKPTTLMEWMNHGGQQNDFDGVLGREWVNPSHYFYASHISLKRPFVAQESFPTDYAGYGWEDLDFGRLMNERGIKLGVLEGAVGLHHHYYSSGAIRERQRATGQGIVIYQRRHPKDEILLPATSIKSTVKRKIANFFLIRSFLWWMVGGAEKRHKSFPRLFQLATTCEFWHGVQQVKSKLSP